jgi:hypothetical protein
MLSPELVTSPPRKKSITTFESRVVDSEDEEQTCLDEIGGGGGK